MEAVTLRGRRDILRLAGSLAVGALLGPRRAAAAVRACDRALALYSINTGEHLRIEYCTEGRYDPEAFAEVSRLLRDHENGATHAIDPTLLDELFVLAQALDTRAAYHVVCGYRSPETNAMSRRRHPGVACHSYHLTGRAIDVFLPDRDLRKVRAAAIAMRSGGVGYYPRSGFVHIDTGPVRRW